MTRKNRFVLVAVALLICVLSIGAGEYVGKRPAMKPESFLSGASTRPIEDRSKTSGCLVQGPFPDPHCTPGAVFENARAEDICVEGYTKTVRNVSVSLKKKVYKAYGISYPQAKGAYEADHLIPLELGGSNDIANLFPEAAKPVPGFKEKDIVENFLHQEVCAGRIDLVSAQRQIAHDWVSVYNALSADEIRKLKERFRSWSPD